MRCGMSRLGFRVRCLSTRRRLARFFMRVAHFQRADTLPSGDHGRGAMDLRDKVLGDVDLDTARVLEVGPLHNPQLRKEEAEVRYIDIARTDELRAKYADNPH